MRLAKYTMEDWPSNNFDWLNVPLRADFEVGVTWGNTVSAKFINDTDIEFTGHPSNFAAFRRIVMQWNMDINILSLDVITNNKNEEVATSVWHIGQLAA